MVCFLFTTLHCSNVYVVLSLKIRAFSIFILFFLLLLCNEKVVRSEHVDSKDRPSLNAINYWCLVDVDGRNFLITNIIPSVCFVIFLMFDWMFINLHFLSFNMFDVGYSNDDTNVSLNLKRMTICFLIEDVIE